MAIPAYSKYHIAPCWDTEYQHLNYARSPFNDPEQVQTWLAQGYPDNFTGQMCDMSQPQPSWNHTITEIYEAKGWKHIGTSYYRMDSGTVLPTHGDKYKKYVDIFNLRGQETSIRRAIIFLEDWQSGHYLECAGEVITGWHAGDVVEWVYDTPHMAANLGTTPRYTLQVTGHL